jgi:SsrA-binding protein
VPLKLYITERGKAKLELGLGRGKQLHDRRRDIAAREARREVERALAEAARR